MFLITFIKSYFSLNILQVHGVIYVIDSSDMNRVQECQQVLADLLSHKKIAGKPVLV